MKLLIDDPGQNRIVRDLWCWIVGDPKTGLEGIVGVMLDGINFQAVSSSREIALKAKKFFDKEYEVNGKRVSLVRFVRQDT